MAANKMTGKKMAGENGGKEWRERMATKKGGRKWRQRKQREKMEGKKMEDKRNKIQIKYLLIT